MEIKKQILGLENMKYEMKVSIDRLDMTALSENSKGRLSKLKDWMCLINYVIETLTASSMDLNSDTINRAIKLSSESKSILGLLSQIGELSEKNKKLEEKINERDFADTKQAKILAGKEIDRRDRFQRELDRVNALESSGKGEGIKLTKNLRLQGKNPKQLSSINKE